jgi:hydrogenase nickel incorporation protein HypA/HybF
VHELSIALSIIDLASEESERRGGVGVRAVHVRLGQLSGVVKSALVSAFELAREESPLASARLVIEETPIVLRCPSCEAETTLDWPQGFESVPRFCCSRCGTPSSDIRSGRELEVTALEIEDECPKDEWPDTHRRSPYQDLKAE